MAKEENKGNLKVWQEFNKYWDQTEWKELDRKKLSKILGDEIGFKVPKDVSTPATGRKFYKLVRDTVKPKRKGGFGGVTVSFKGTAGEGVFGKGDLTYPEINKKLHAFIAENELKKTPSKKAKAAAKKDVDDEDDE